jgi:hypothetical protein
VYSNTIINPPSEEEVINNEDQGNNTFEDNEIIPLPSNSSTSSTLSSNS